MSPHPIPLACTAALLLAGCTVGPTYVRPTVALPAAFAQAPAPTVASTPVAPDVWWRSFDDPVLARVVTRALSQNLDLEQARDRIAQSRAAARAANAALYPQGELRSSAASVEQSLLSPFGAVGSQVPGFERDYDLSDFGAAASWEIDLFGGLRRARQAARAEAEAAGDDAAAVRLSIAAETADAYLRLRTYQARLRVAREQEAVQQRLAALVEQRRGDGLASERERHQALAALEGVRATIPPLTTGVEGELARLDVLMGGPAGAYSAQLRSQADLPTAPPDTRLGGPADLLRRRPDILAAERRLAASDARIGAAISDYYPKLSISGLLGVESLDTSRIFVGDAVEHTVTGGLRWRLFDFGRVDAEVARAKGREAEMLAAYRGVVYRASGEVETALADLVQSRAQAATLTTQITELRRARDQAQEAYQSGAVSLIEVLDADRDLLAASDKLAQAQSEASRAAVAVYRALGQPA